MGENGRGRLVVTVRHGEMIELTLPDGQTAEIHLQDVGKTSPRVRLRFEAPPELRIHVTRESEGVGA